MILNVIGFEKAGIYRSGKPAICGQPKAPATVAAHADDIGAELYQVGIQYDYQVIDEHPLVLESWLLSFRRASDSIIAFAKCSYCVYGIGNAHI